MIVKIKSNFSDSTHYGAIYQSQGWRATINAIVYSSEYESLDGLIKSIK